MSLLELKKELEEQIIEAKKAEDAPEEEVVEEPETPEAPAAPAEPEKPAEEPAKEPEEELDASGHRRLRREAAAAKKRAEDAEAKLAEATQPAVEIAEKPVVDADIAEMKENFIISKAEREFKELESKFRRSNPEYDDIVGQYGQAIMASIKIQSPRISEDELVERTKKTILQKASKYMQDGFDPIEEMFHEARDLGFKKREVAAPAKEEKEVEIKPDMKKVSANRARSASMAGTGGDSTKAQINKSVAAEMSPMEWKKLPREEKARLLAS